MPVLSRETIRNAFDDLLSQSHDRPTYQTYTSGSTGQPLKIIRDAEAAAWYWASEYRGREWHGWNVGDKYGFFWGIPRDSIGKKRELLKDPLLNRIRFSANEIPEKQARSFYQKCMRFKPEYFWGYPSSIYDFARVITTLRLDGKALDVKLIKSSAEMLHEFQKEFLEATFDCKVYNDYGACELGHVAFECPQGRMHLSIENCCIEILDNNDRPVDDGKIGKVVLTNLVNFAMPLIRYEIGDMASLSTENCPCGMSLPLIKNIKGRSIDRVIDENGNVMGDHVLYYLIEDIARKEKLDSVRQIKFIQRARNELIVKIVKGTNFTDTITDFLTSEIHGILGPSFQIRFEFPDQIPVEESGKFRYFISELSLDNHNT